MNIGCKAPVSLLSSLLELSNGSWAAHLQYRFISKCEDATYGYFSFLSKYCFKVEVILFLIILLTDIFFFLNLIQLNTF